MPHQLLMLPTSTVTTVIQETGGNDTLQASSASLARSVKTD